MLALYSLSISVSGTWRTIPANCSLRSPSTSQFRTDTVHPFSDPRARLSPRGVWPPPSVRKIPGFRSSLVPLSAPDPHRHRLCVRPAPVPHLRRRADRSRAARILPATRRPRSEKAAATSGEGARGCLARSVLRTERKNSRLWGGACSGPVACLLCACLRSATVPKSAFLIRST